MSRYDDLLALQPSTPRWRALGTILPFRDDPHQLPFEGLVPGKRYRYAVGDEERGSFEASGDGVGLLSLVLDPGDHEIRILDEETLVVTSTFVTVRALATMIAGAAEPMERNDAEILSVKRATSLATVDSMHAPEVYGAELGMPTTLDYELEAYRRVLRQLRPAYRHLGGLRAGIEEAGMALTGVRPLIVPRAWLPHWHLGGQLLDNGDFAARTRVVVWPAVSALNARARTAVGILSAGNEGAVRDVRPRRLITVMDGDDANTTFEPRHQPRQAVELEVTFEVGWDGGAVTITGADANGGVETVTLTPVVENGVVQTEQVVRTQPFAHVTEVSKSRIGLDVFTGHCTVEAIDPQQLTLWFSTDWNGGVVTVTGTQPNGEAVSEDVELPPSTATTRADRTMTTLHLYADLDSVVAVEATGSTVGTVEVGYARAPFVEILDVSPGVALGDVALLFTPASSPPPRPDRLRLGTGAEVTISRVKGAEYTLAGAGGSIRVRVDPTYLPATATDTLTIVGGLVDAWRLAPTSAFTSTDAYLHASGTATAEASIPRALDYKGLFLGVVAWARGAGTIALDVTWDGGTTWTPLVASEATRADLPTTGASFARAGASEVRIQVPWDATDVRLRVQTTGTVTIEGVHVVAYPSAEGSDSLNGYYLGSGTIPRLWRDEVFRSMVYAWASTPMTTAERASLGVPAPPAIGGAGTVREPEGHLDRITFAHGRLERADVTRYGAGTNVTRLRRDGLPVLLRPLTVAATNLRGAYGLEGWQAAGSADGFVNMELVPARPTHASGVRPTRPSTIEELPLDVDAGGYATVLNWAAAVGRLDATGTTWEPGPNDRLSEAPSSVADHDPFTVPVLPSAWRWGEATIEPPGEDTPIDLASIVRVVGGEAVPETLHTTEVWIDDPVAGSLYTLTHDVRVSAETAPFALNDEEGAHVWLVDFAAYLRREPKVETGRRVLRDGEDVWVPYTRTEWLTPSADYRARLSTEAVTDPATAKLVVNDGRERSVLPGDQGGWSFVDGRTVRLPSSAVNARATLELTYQAKVLLPERVVGYVLEWRRAESAEALAAAAYEVVSPNQVVDGSATWHQLRVSFSSVRFASDVFVYGLGLKGIRLRGDAPFAPGILVPVT